uniref:Uncharacterized protein n=1 Tax=Heterorhabditis bacteriophora TaxID=37862 RepID=A0A1I7WAW4_HETBA
MSITRATRPLFGGLFNTLKRIKETRERALLGGGQKRIDTQHARVDTVFVSCFSVKNFVDFFRQFDICFMYIINCESLS